MLRFAANISTLFTELPLRARFSAARMAGFEAVECQLPYEINAGAALAEIETNGLQLVLLNAPPGDWEAGERGLAALRGREGEFENAVQAAFDYAETVGCRLVHVMAGIVPATEDWDRALDTYVENLSRAATEAAERGITIVIEPINRRDMPGYFLSRTEEARRVIDAVGHKSLGLLFDVYHRQVAEGDVTRALRENMDLIRHIQVANPPDRCSPDQGELDFDYIFAALREAGYEGWIGCEYRPGSTTRDSLGWFDKWRPLRKRAGEG